MSFDSISFYNRCSKKITIERISLLEFKITGFEEDFIRIGKDGEDVTMVDFPGGPMIMSKDNMIRFNPEWQDFIIEKIKLPGDNCAIFDCVYTKKIDWIKLK